MRKGVRHSRESGNLNRNTKDWHTTAVTLSATKGLGLRFFAPLRMTSLNGYLAKCLNVVWFDLEFTALIPMGLLSSCQLSLAPRKS